MSCVGLSSTSGVSWWSDPRATRTSPAAPARMTSPARAARGRVTNLRFIGVPLLFRIVAGVVRSTANTSPTPAVAHWIAARGGPSPVHIGECPGHVGADFLGGFGAAYRTEGSISAGLRESFGTYSR